jgi:hypothetical protein
MSEIGDLVRGDQHIGAEALTETRWCQILCQRPEAVREANFHALAVETNRFPYREPTLRPMLPRPDSGGNFLQLIKHVSETPERAKMLCDDMARRFPVR